MIRTLILALLLIAPSSVDRALASQDESSFEQRELQRMVDELFALKWNLPPELREFLRTQASNEVVVRAGDLPREVFDAIAFNSTPMIDSDAELEETRVPRFVPGGPPPEIIPTPQRLIWGAKVGRYYLVHLEYWISGYRRRLIVLEYDDAGDPIWIWEGQSDSAFELPFSAPGRFSTFAEFQSALANDGVMRGDTTIAENLRQNRRVKAANESLGDLDNPTMPRALRQAIESETEFRSIRFASQIPDPVRAYIALTVYGIDIADADVPVTAGINQDFGSPAVQLNWGAQIGQYVLVSWVDRRHWGRGQSLAAYELYPDGGASLVWEGQPGHDLADGGFEAFKAAVLAGMVATMNAGVYCLNDLDLPYPLVRILFQSDPFGSVFQSTSSVPPARGQAPQFPDVRFSTRTLGDVFRPERDELKWIASVGDNYIAHFVGAELRAEEGRDTIVQVPRTVIFDPAMGNVLIWESILGFSFEGPMEFRRFALGNVSPHQRSMIEQDKCVGDHDGRYEQLMTFKTAGASVQPER